MHDVGNCRIIRSGRLRSEMDQALSSLPDPEVSRQEYVYEDLGEHCIRLFKIEPADNFDAEVCGELIVASFAGDDDPEPYNALSYSWGPTFSDRSHLSESIVCGGRSLRVTPSLKTALRHIRAYGYNKPTPMFGQGTEDSSADTAEDGLNPTRPLWVDAICINQTNLSERASQVDYMICIYYNSATVLVWLGESDGQLDTWLSTPRSGVIDRNMLPLGASARRKSSALSQPTPSRICDPHINDMLTRILDFRWFRRRWVLQEIFYARRCSLLIGGFICSRECMYELHEATDIFAGALPFRISEAGGALLEACRQFDACECSDPRDRVFALKYMCDKEEDVDVDYSLGVRDVYLQMIQRTVVSPSPRLRRYDRPSLRVEDLKCHRILRMLAISSCKQRRAALKGKPEIESWIPDWRAATTYTSSQHKVAVTELTSRHLEDIIFARDESWPQSLARASTFTAAGYCYLRLRGRLLRRSRQDSTKLLQNRSNARERPGNFTLALLQELPKSHGDRDCVLLFSRERPRLAVGFVLRRGVTQTRIGTLPVYRLYSCLVFRERNMVRFWGELAGENHGGVLELMSDGWFKDQTYFDVTDDAEFYLE